MPNFIIQCEQHSTTDTVFPPICINPDQISEYLVDDGVVEYEGRLMQAFIADATPTLNIGTVNAEMPTVVDLTPFLSKAINGDEAFSFARFEIFASNVNLAMATLVTGRYDTDTCLVRLWQVLDAVAVHCSKLFAEMDSNGGS